jgi:hypothetical protein
MVGYQKPEARSQKPEARSKEEHRSVLRVLFWLLTIVSRPFWLLASTPS